MKLASMDYYDFEINNKEYRLFINGNVIRIQEDGTLIEVVKPKLRELCKLLNIEIKYAGSGSDSTTNNSYAKKILKQLEENNL